MYHPPAPFIAPISGDIDQRLAQIAEAITFRLVRLESQVQQLANRQAQTVSGQAPGAQPAVNSTTFVAIGLGVSFTTGNPIKYSRWMVTVGGQISNNANNGNSYAQLFHGVGTPPARGTQMSAVGGISDGLPGQLYAAQANDTASFSRTELATLTQPSTQYWFDLGARAQPGGCVLSNIDLVAVSLLDPLALQ